LLSAFIRVDLRPNSFPVFQGAVVIAVLGALEGRFWPGDPQCWLGLGALVFAGLVTGALFERLKRARRRDAAAEETGRQLAHERETRQCMLESIIQSSPAAIALLCGPDFTFAMVNPAYQALSPGEPMAGRTVAEVWPAAAPLVAPLLRAVRDSRVAYHAEGFAIPLHHAPGSAAEERYFDFSYVPLAGPDEAADGDVRILVVAIEVTAYKRTGEALRAAWSELAAIHANAPVALLVIDEEYHVQKVNELAARFAGREMADMLGLSPGSAIGCLNALASPQGCGHGPSCSHCPLRLAVLDTLSRGTRHDGDEAWLAFSDGGVPQQRCLLFSTAAMGNGHTGKVLVCVQDITEMKRAQLELLQQHEALERQAELINLSHDAIVISGPDRVIRGWNRGAEEVYGWLEAEAAGQVSDRLLKASSAVSTAEIAAILSRNGRWEGEVRHTRRDGQQIVSDSRQILLHGAAGAAIGILEINRDITQSRRAEDALLETVRKLESALTEKTVLLKEVHHRVKNNLAVISSLLSMKADAANSPEARLALEESQQRVHSMALIHEHLYGSDHLDRVSFSQYARQLVDWLSLALVDEPGRISIEMDLEPLELGIERAVPCALILNELLSNAFKYAFPGRRKGRILVSLREPQPGHLELAVEDNGIGFPAGLPGGRNTKSLGLRIVAILTSQLDGSLEHEASTGTRMVLRFQAHIVM